MSVRTKFSFHTLSVRRGLVVASICAFAFFCIGAEPPPPRVLLSWERNWNDTTEFPVVQVDNQTDAAVESTLFFRMYDTDGNVLREEKQTISAPPGEKLSLDGLRQFPRPEKPVLVTVEGEKLHAANGGRRLPDRRDHGDWSHAAAESQSTTCFRWRPADRRAVQSSRCGCRGTAAVR